MSWSESEWTEETAAAAAAQCDPSRPHKQHAAVGVSSHDMVYEWGHNILKDKWKEELIINHSKCILFLYSVSRWMSKAALIKNPMFWSQYCKVAKVILIKKEVELKDKEKQQKKIVWERRMFSQKSKCYFCTIYHLDYCKEKYKKISFACTQFLSRRVNASPRT